MVGLKEQIECAKKIIPLSDGCSNLCIACPLSIMHPKGYGGSFECSASPLNSVALKGWLDLVEKFLPTGREESVRRMASLGDCLGACFSCAFSLICRSAGKDSVDQAFMIALAKAWVVDNPEKTKTPEKTWKPIEKFEVGKWYRYHGKECHPGWVPQYMSFVLDGKSRICISVYGASQKCAAFNESGEWYWTGGFENWEEVPDPTKPVEKAKSDLSKYESYSSIGYNPLEYLSTWRPYSAKPAGTPNIPEPIHITPSRPSRALIGGLSKRSPLKPKFTKPLDLRK